jgi:predicted AAA+ superfamily ATPase
MAGRLVLSRLPVPPAIWCRLGVFRHGARHQPEYALQVFSRCGASWEGFVLENLISSLPGWRASFYRTQAGAELDLVLERGRRRFAVECKASSAPTVTRGFWSAMTDLELNEAYVVAPVRTAYPLGPGAAVTPLPELLEWCPQIQEGRAHPAVQG